MSSDPTKTGVKYIGNDTPFVDALYGSGLKFMPDQTRLVEPELAAKLTRHAEFVDDDTFDYVTATTNLTGVIEFSAGNSAVAVQQLGPYNENKLTAVDYLPWLFYSKNSTYRFGKSGTVGDGILYRQLLADGTMSNGANVTSLYKEDGTTLITSGSVMGAWAWDDLLLMQVLDITTGKYHLYKSIDNGATFGANSPLFNDGKVSYSVGWNVAKSTSAAVLSIMAQWSLCRGTNYRGEDMIVFGQYNTNGLRTAGGANDWSNVICSRNGGTTWDVALELNTGGTNIVRHCHACFYDSYTAEFWICYGDGTESAYYVWDGVRAAPANVRASEIAQYKGWRGMDQFNNPTGDYYTGQVTILLFTPTEVIAPIDHGYTAARGIYTLSRDLTVFQKLTGGLEIGQPVNHSLYSGCIDPVSKTMFVSSLIEPDGTNVSADWTLWIWAATKDGNYRDWKRVGRYMCDTLRTSRTHQIFTGEDDGKLYIGSSGGAGKDYHSTAICTVDGVFESGDEEAVIHPVYWVHGTAGLDTNTGYSPATAYKTLNWALRSSRVTTSSLVNVAAGPVDEGTSSYTLGVSSSAKPAQTNYPVIVRGAGRKATIDTGNTVAGIFNQGATGAHYRFESMSFVNLAQGSIFNQSSTTPISITVEFRDVYLNTGGSVGIRADSGRSVISEFEADLGSGGQLVRADFTAYQQIVEVKSGVARGGKYIVGWQGAANSSCLVEHVTGILQTQCGIDAQAAATVIPTVKNCAFDSATAGVRDSRTVKTSADNLVDYNVYKTANSTLVGGDQHSKTSADLQLIGSSGIPKQSSPVIAAGTLSVSAVNDAFGDPLVTPRNAGAF